MSQPHVEPSLSYTPNIGQVVWSASAPPSGPAKDKPLLIMIKRMNDKTNSTKLTYKPKQNSSQSTCSADSTASKKKICSTELISRLTSAATFPLISWWKSMACVRVADSFEPEGSAISEISQMRMKKKTKKTSSPSPRNARQKACSSFCSAAWEPRADVAHLPSNFREKLRKTKQKEKKKEKKKEVRSLHRREGHLVPAALHQRVEWHKSRESHGGENQQWPCQRWQLSGKQSIKAGTTCHLHSFFFCKLLACSWPAFSEQKWSPPFPLIYPHHSEKTFVESCSRVSQLSLC